VEASPAAVETARVVTTTGRRECVATAPGAALRSAERSEGEEDEPWGVANVREVGEEDAACRPRQPAPLRTTARRVMRAMTPERHSRSFGVRAV
jgi:hypothetical protein